jgi:hypothetical protein
MSQYGYNSSNAATFNQLVRTGVTEEEAAVQSGVSTSASQYGFGTNSNAGAVIPGAGGATNAAGLTTVSYAQSGTGEPGQQPPQTSAPAAGTSYSTFQDPAQRAGQNSLTTPQPSASPFAAFNRVETVPITAPAPSTFQDPAQRAAAAAAIVPPAQQAAEPAPAPSPITETPSDSRIISTTPNASSGFGYGTGINNPSVAPTTAADTVNANTSGIPIRNEEGAVVEGIRTNPETGETYYTEPPAADSAEFQPKSFAAADVSSSFTQAPGEAGRGITAPGDVSLSFVQAPGERGRGIASPALVKPGESLQAQASAAAGPGSTPIGAEIDTPASLTESGKLLAQRQAALAAQKKLVNNNGDWRVRISLADSSDYLYNAPFPDLGILAPLKATFGVIFPYTPTISVGYKANYSTADLTHSNYTNYFYQGSSVGQVRITGTFTAQDTVEADYLLAVIHFFRSATKMFYGQDAQRGAPPPLLFISGLGEYQFNNQACVLASFDYSLPADVDYIRAGSPNNNGTDLLKRRTSTQNNLPTNPISGALGRLEQLFSGQKIQKGGIVYQNAPSSLSKNSPTYVPTKIDITLTLNPVVTRSQASRQFSLKQFANGDLVKQGFW